VTTPFDSVAPYLHDSTKIISIEEEIMGLITGGRRTRIVVDKGFQIRTTLGGIVYILAVAVFLGFPLVEMMGHIDTLLQGRPEDLATFYKTQKAFTIASTALFVVGILGAWTVFSLWRTHKIAGPLVKITRYVHQFATGNFGDRIVLRDRDQLQALATALNNMARSLQERDEAIQADIVDHVERARRRLYDTPGAEEGLEALERLSETVNGSFNSRWEAPEPPREPVRV
jgi:methyl-accepting chemotaxis protein